MHADWWEATGGARIELAPLGAEAVESIIDELLGQASLSPATRRRVVSAAEGNPLYVEQLRLDAPRPADRATATTSSYHPRSRRCSVPASTP